MYKIVTAPTSAQIATFLPMKDIRYALNFQGDGIGQPVDDTSKTRLAALRDVAYFNIERQYLQRAILTQTWDYFTDAWENTFELAYPPMASVTHVKYYDSDNALQTATANTDYRANVSEYLGKVEMINTFSLYDRDDAINIQFIAGVAYGSVDQRIKEAILEKLFALYNKEDRDGTILNLIGDMIVYYEPEL